MTDKQKSFSEDSENKVVMTAQEKDTLIENRFLAAANVTATGLGQAHFSNLCQLLDFRANLPSSSTTVFASAAIFRQITQQLEEKLTTELRQYLHSGKPFSLMLDSTTDITGKKQVGVLIRILGEEMKP
ncbi:hypothetical protein BLNAU_17623 [Blattamonas nauphoetae]|uniref:DUF4371 domain-containing protein n=1 Tax=Blattamonas nauphoetae TaxID=2049346 RepID=A0ABQ9X774_9EUKA|nr:hypothetical protein BLNAU_17623 [Blattamonas nauphoetae]